LFSIAEKLAMTNRINIIEVSAKFTNASSKPSVKKFKPAIEPPYRWRDWAAKSDGITGDELLSFINSEEASLPNGKKGPGLFRYLRLLTSSDSAGVADTRRDVIATVFKGVQNRMVSGYLLRDVINKLNGIHFTASDELHTLGALYESMLREMRDAAGDSGEFYTPRAVVRFIVTVTNPRLGETVLDPASGTGGFLVEAFNHLSQQVKTVADRKVLQEESLFGCEPKTLPYLLCQMNLLLHGLDAPQIDPGNSLRFKLTDIGERDRVDVILTNPPFGGEEEKGIQGNFPEDKQTAETALLFLQLIMRKLRKHSLSAMGRGTKGEVLPARAAVVVPNGTLFGNPNDTRTAASLQAAVEAARQRIARGEVPLEEMEDISLSTNAQSGELSRRSHFQTAALALFWESRPPEWWAKLTAEQRKELEELLGSWRAEREKILGELPIADRCRLEALRPEDFDKPGALEP
jgi:type I restriction-modification system DNA methylase subunit